MINASHAWLSRIPRNGPWLVSLLLAALIAGELVRISIALHGGNPIKLVAPPVTEQAFQAMNHSRVDIGSIAAAHLFGVIEDDSNRDPANAPATTANLVLAGTIATENPKHGLAIITADGPSKVYRVGDDVVGATLHSVYSDHVILARGGRLETLVLPRLLVSTTAVVVARSVQPTSGAAAVDLRPGLKDPHSLADVMRTEPALDNQAGTLRGFRIYSGRNRSAFSGSGLRAGDLVTAVNGTPLADQDRQRARELFDAIQTAGRATVTIVRNNQTRDISIDMPP